MENTINELLVLGKGVVVVYSILSIAIAIFVMVMILKIWKSINDDFKKW